MEVSEHMVRRIKQMPDKYYLILEPEMVNVCFWYLPTRVRNMPHGPERIKIIADVRFLLFHLLGTPLRGEVLASLWTLLGTQNNEMLEMEANSHIYVISSRR